MRPVGFHNARGGSDPLPGLHVSGQAGMLANACPGSDGTLHGPSRSPSAPIRSAGLRLLHCGRLSLVAACRDIGDAPARDIDPDVIQIVARN